MLVLLLLQLLLLQILSEATVSTTAFVASVALLFAAVANENDPLTYNTDLMEPLRILNKAAASQMLKLQTSCSDSA